MKSKGSFLIAVIGSLVLAVCVLAIFIACGFARWPAFNAADSAIVVCGIILIDSFISRARMSKRQPAAGALSAVLGIYTYIKGRFYVASDL